MVGPGPGAQQYVNAPSKTEALIDYWRTKWSRAVNAKEAQAVRTREIAAIVGLAIREGGSTEIPANDPALPYVEFAQTLGFAGRSHSRAGRKWLLVARDEAGLNAIKGDLDRQNKNNPAG